jgi:hypothetical protein
LQAYATRHRSDIKATWTSIKLQTPEQSRQYRMPISQICARMKGTINPATLRRTCIGRYVCDQALELNRQGILQATAIFNDMQATFCCILQGRGGNANAAVAGIYIRLPDLLPRHNLDLYLFSGTQGIRKRQL